MTKAIRIMENGGYEVMQYVEVEVGDPGPGEVRVRHHAVGLNYIDVYFRMGLYTQPLPAGIGMEASGFVEAVGTGVTHVKPGDRVAYASNTTGAYAEVRVMSASALVRLPDAISFEQAAAMMLKGMTAQYLLHSTYHVKLGDTILIHAAAGGVGLILCQWAKSLGARVIGTVGSEEKAALAHSYGCDYPIVYTREHFVDRVKYITDGEGVSVVYDSIGKETFIDSLDCLRRLGLMVSFGNASCPIDQVKVADLISRGSLFFTRPTLFNYMATRLDLENMARDLFDVVIAGRVKIHVNQRYVLSDVAQAHRDIEERKTTGSTILIP
ncbi:quinone oxidoreductase family protein [Candidatus Pandoraea novymonadis]|uniref:Quinone oxidoreductase 1 n=1 Tax=Candidatus Pandoraea novymonadis TaxID=1808959 RepID=A0ABX5FD83_9BURK|nr:quinone oxidoreductase [Candidatus Pandoraea novymonadis]PSB91664.1 Quinone oxidoreductase 1 [Candidatus Pandoraea novymonadis]